MLARFGSINMGCKVSILGTCILRDILGMHEGYAGYSVERFVQSVNPVSAVSNVMLLKEFDWDDQSIYTKLKKKNNFYKRILKLDLSKQVFSYMSETQSEYLMIDAGDFRLRMLHDSMRGGI